MLFYLRRFSEHPICIPVPILDIGDLGLKGKFGFKPIIYIGHRVRPRKNFKVRILPPAHRFRCGIRITAPKHSRFQQ